MDKVPNLLRTITPDRLTFPRPFATNEELLSFANALIRPHPSKAVEIYMILDVVQSVASFVVCFSVMFKKHRVKDTRTITLRRTRYGTFIIPNAIWWLLSLVSVYLLGWAGFCSWILYVQERDRPLSDWLFYIPLPWLPLILGAFYSTYGLVLTCTPRSPISNLGKVGASRDSLRWYHFPLPRSAWVMNTFMIGTGLAMVVYNIVITIMNGKAMHLTRKSGHNVYADLLLQEHSQEWLKAAPTQETLDFVKLAWSDLANVYRLCCAALASYCALIFVIIIMLVVYAIPNQIFLMDHLLKVYPDDKRFQQPQERTVVSLSRALWQIGLPRHLHGSQYVAFKKSWMLVMVGHAQIFLILAGVFTFAVPAFFLVFVPWRKGWVGATSETQVKFIVAYCITAAFLSAGWIISMSGMLTFDDIYRVVSGLERNSETDSESSNGRRDTRRAANIPLKPASSSISLVDSSRPIRAKSSLRASIASQEAEKEDSINSLEVDPNQNKLRVVTETVVMVHYDHDVEGPADPQPQPSRTTSYHYLGRKKTLD